MARRLTLERSLEVSQLAESVSEYYFPETWIDPEQILRTNKVTISFNRYGSFFDGMLECKNRKFHVYCNLDRVESSTSPRARFTLAHELGHYFLDGHRNALLQGKVPSHPSFCCQPDALLVTEKEADLFASRLLIPEARFQKAANICNPSLAVISSIQDTFKVSFQSAAIRVIEGASVPCVGVMWRQSNKPWRVINAPMMEIGFTKMQLKLDSLPPDCATKLCWDETPLPNRLHSPRESVASPSHWFWGVFTQSARAVYFREECVRLGAYGCFSILTLHPALSA